MWDAYLQGDRDAPSKHCGELLGGVKITTCWDDSIDVAAAILNAKAAGAALGHLLLESMDV